jgi:hypothetical protein
LENIKIDFHVRTLPVRPTNYRSWYETVDMVKVNDVDVPRAAAEQDAVNSNTDPKWKSQAGVGVITTVKKWNMTVKLGNFYIGNTITMQGATMALAQKGEVYRDNALTTFTTIPVGDVNAVGVVGGIVAGEGSAPVATGNAGIAGANFEGVLRATNHQNVDEGLAQAELIWTFIPDVPDVPKTD